MAALDWFTEDVQKRHAEIYASFHPDEVKNKETEESKKQVHITTI